jgi:cytochrome c5
MENRVRVRVRVATRFAGAAAFAALASVAGAQPATNAAMAAAGAPQALAQASNTVDMVHAKASFQSLCSKCHDLGQATSQNHDRAGWKEVVQRMTGFGLVASDDEVKEVVEYLAATHPADQ